jgi:N-sulfoglucosamine sulfohydrolase
MPTLFRISRYLLFNCFIAVLFNFGCTKIQKNLSGTTGVYAEIRPNILFILAEDHSAQLGVYGDTYVSTPNLDRLAEQGVRFENAYVTQAGCSPSRASILTGLYPHQHGQIGLATHGMRLFEGNIPNMPAILKEHGYRTGNIGKIHVTPESVFQFDYHNNAAYNRFGKRDISAVANEAENFIDSGGKPFYLQVNFADAHLPFISQEYGIPDKPYAPDQIGTLPFVGLRTDLALQQTADYYSCMARLDSAVKLLLDVLEKTGEIQNTLVIYMSDHGAEVPRGKMTSFEGGIHVPLIMWMPGHIDAGMVRKELVSTIDLMPTILALLVLKYRKAFPAGHYCHS